MHATLQYVLYIAVLLALAIPLGIYISKAMGGEKTVLTRLLAPCERGLYRLLHIDSQEDMNWKRYAGCALAFSAISLAVLTLILKFQNILPWNPQNVDGMSWHLAFYTAVSLITNTNWQAYSGEVALSSFSQALGLTVQNFVSAGVGIAVLFAIIRGFVRTKAKGIGNFWADLVRSVVYVLLPLCFVMSIALVSLGVPQSLGESKTVDLLEPIAVSQQGEVIEGAKIDLDAGTVTLDGQLVDGAKIVTKQAVPLFPQASQVAPKQVGTNGGGVLGNNSAHPFENPNPATNLIEMISLLLIPAALCISFGRSVKNKKQGVAILVAMTLVLIAALSVVAINEHQSTPQLAQNGAVQITAEQGYAGGNMEGKETRFGIATSSTWAAFTTAASNGSVNSMHDSYTPLGGMVPMLLMQLGEVIFGGVGCGLYGMLGFVLLTVFIAGLMVGRTPEYLGKKIGPKEMRMAVLVCLATPIAILVGSGIAAMLPSTAASLNNAGAHGFSEMLYAYSSCGGNNGSAFAGFNANTPFLNVSLGLVMLFARFVPMVATLLIAGSMAAKKRVAASAGTLSTSNAMFVFLLILIVLIVGALSFFPALALGPIAEFTQMLGLG